MQRVPVRLVSDSAEWLEGLTRQLGAVDDIVVAAHQPLSALGRPGTPAVLVVDGTALDQALAAIARQAQQPGSACILLLGPGEDPARVYPQAALRGARLVLPGSVELPALTEAIYRAADWLGPAAAAAESRGQAADRLITVFGTKGGVGKTTLAVNLAAWFAQRGLKTALLDMHLDWGNAAIHLRLAAPRPLSDLLTEAARLDPDLLQSFMAHHASGVDVLPAPPKPEMAEFITPGHVQAVLMAACEAYEAVVVDTPPGFPDTLQPVLEATDHLVLVTAPEVPTLRNTRAALRILDMLRLTRPRLHLVLNRAGQGQGVRQADVEATLGTPVWASVPDDEALARRSANEGVPAITLAPASRLARAVGAVADLLVPPEGPVAPAGGTALAVRREARARA